MKTRRPKDLPGNSPASRQSPGAANIVFRTRFTNWGLLEFVPYWDVPLTVDHNDWSAGGVEVPRGKHVFVAVNLLEFYIPRQGI